MDTFLKGVVLPLIVAALVAGGVVVVMQHQAPTGKTLSAAAGPDLPFQYLKWGGVEEWRASATFSATSSVPVAIQNPVAATSSIDFVGCNIGANALGAQNFDISTSSTALASSTPALIYGGSLASGAQKSIAWVGGNASTTNSKVIGGDSFLKTGESPYLLGPLEYVTFRIATGTPGVFAGGYLTGSCSLKVTPIGR